MAPVAVDLSVSVLRRQDKGFYKDTMYTSRVALLVAHD
jgi:hypothetical protein